MKRLFPSLQETATLGSVFRRFPAKLGPLVAQLNLVMRGESDLTIAQRELIAAYVSGLNACAFCHGAHSVHAQAFGVDVGVIEAVIQDPLSAPVDPKLRPILSYVSKLTRTPAMMIEEDAKAVYDAGWSEDALFDAVQVCGLFNMMNRILEGTGITEYYLDPENVEEHQLAPLRSEECYTEFGRQNGVTD
ncbi:peroxidase-related enzyme [Rhodobacteraceae bacterium M382]|nr:peroxidase-related enzyme [Rhodobacteraceae bacterium M382]